MDFLPNIYTLEDEEGNKLEFELVDSMEYNGKTYYAMIPYNENPEDILDDDGQLIILQGETIDDEDMLATVDDEDVYNEVGEIFIERINEMFEE